VPTQDGTIHHADRPQIYRDTSVGLSAHSTQDEAVIGDSLLPPDRRANLVVDML
jgi:hypothetical protein